MYSGWFHLIKENPMSFTTSKYPTPEQLLETGLDEAETWRNWTPDDPLHDDLVAHSKEPTKWNHGWSVYHKRYNVRNS